MRAITNDDIWSAFRGCRMASCSDDELQRLFLDNKESENFAGRVIAEAAKQAMGVRVALAEYTEI